MTAAMIVELGTERQLSAESIAKADAVKDKANQAFKGNTCFDRCGQHVHDSMDRWQAAELVIRVCSPVPQTSTTSRP